MVSNFALLLSHDGIRLAHRTAEGWREVGCVDLNSEDMASDLEALRKKGEALNGGVFSTKIVLPDDQIKYLSLPTPENDDDRADAIREALERSTPYLIDELAYDWEEGEDALNVAAAARDTLTEAEQFAVQFGFNPLGFVASPADTDFSVEPFFGATKAAAHILDDASEFEAELNKVVLISDAKDEASDAPSADEDASETPDPQDAADGETAEDAIDQADEPTEAKDTTEAEDGPDDLDEELAEIAAMIAADEDPAEEEDASAEASDQVEDEADEVPAEENEDETDTDEADATDDAEMDSSADAEEENDPSEQKEDTPEDEDDDGPGLSALLRADRKSVPEDTSAKRIGPAVGPAEGFVAGRRALDDPDLQNKSLPDWAPPVSAEKALSFDEDLDAKRIAWLKGDTPKEDDTSVDPAPSWIGGSTGAGEEDAEADQAPSWVPPKDTPAGETVYDRIADEDDAEQPAASAKSDKPFGLMFPDQGDDGRKKIWLIAALIALILVLGGGLFAARSWFFASPTPQVAVPLEEEALDPEAAEDLALVEETPPEVLETTPAEDLVPVEPEPLPDEALPVEDVEADLIAAEEPALEAEPVVEDPVLPDATEAEATADQDFDTELAFEPEGEPGEEIVEEEPLAASDLEISYVATGIWPVAPDAPDAPIGTSIGDLFITGLDPQLRVSDAVAITSETDMLSDAPLDAVPNPPALGTSFNRDERGLVRATAEGAATPDGAIVFAGQPPIVPPLAPGRPDPVSEAEAARAALVDKQPQLRPEPEVETAPANPALKGKIPRLRPAAIAEQAEVLEIIADNPLALASTAAPRLRPSNMAAIVTSTERAAVAAQTTRPAAPSSASVSGAATQQDAIPLREINLIGVYGGRNDRRALIRLSNGRYVKVEVGSKVDGGTVTAIDATKLYYSKSGKSYVLEIPGN